MGKLRTLCWIILWVLVLSGCAQKKGSFENSGPESGEQESTQAYVEPEKEPLPEEERGSFILEDEEAVYACGYSQILKIDKQGNHSSVLWSSNDNRAAESYRFSDGRALLLQNKIYFIEVSDSGDGLGDVCVLSVINKDGTGYEQVEMMDGSAGGLFFVDDILYITYYGRADDRGRKTGAYEIHKDGAAVKIQDVYSDTPYQYMPEGYREFDCLTVPESYKRFGRLLLPIDQERRLAVFDPEIGNGKIGTLIPIKGFVEAANDELLLDMACERGINYLYLVDGTSLTSKLLGKYEDDYLHILGMDSEYIYAEMKKWLEWPDETEEEQHSYYRISLKTGDREELFTLNEMDGWSQACFYPYMTQVFFREGYIYYGEWRDYKMYLMRRNTEAPEQEEVLGEAYYDSGISRIGKVESYKKNFYSQSDPGVLLSKADFDRLVVDERFSGAGEVNRYLEKVQEDAVTSIKKEAEQLEHEVGSLPEHHAYSHSGRVSEIYYFDGTYVSFCQSEHDYWGGAHGMPYWRSLTFNLETGKKLVLEDVIDNSGEELRDIITRYFGELVGKNPDAYWCDAVSQVRETAGYDTGFYLTRDGIRFYYPPYALACFAAGFQEVTIPYAEFKMKIPVG